MKPIYNLVDTQINIPELKILAQASAENIPVPATYIVTKAAYEKRAFSKDLLSQLKTVYDALSENKKGQLILFLSIDNEVTSLISKKGFDGFIETLESFPKDYPLKKSEFFILVQKNIPPESSGILFTHNIEINDYNNCLIEAVYGEGGVFQKGFENTDRYLVDKRKEKISEKTITKQSIMYMPGSRGNKIDEVEISTKWQSKQKLEDRQILVLMEIARYLEENFESNLEITWAYEAGKIFIVNIRRISFVNEVNVNQEIEENEVEIIPSNEPIEEIPVIEPAPKIFVPPIPPMPIMEEPINNVNDFIPQFLKSESEFKQEIPKKFQKDAEIIDEEIALDNITETKPDLTYDQVVQNNVEKTVITTNEEVLIRGIGVMGGIVQGYATLNPKNNADILIVSDIEELSKKDAGKFAAIVTTNMIGKLPKYISNITLIASANLATKIIKEGEEIKVNGSNGKIYEVIKKQTEQEATQEAPQIPAFDYEPIEVEVASPLEPKEELNIPEVETKEIPEVKIPEKIIMTATKVFLKSNSKEIEDNENLSGYIVSTKNLNETANITKTKNILVQFSDNIEENCETIKRERNGPHKNIWIILPKTRRFSEIEEYRKRMYGLRRSSTFKIFGMVATPSNALLIADYLEYALDGIYIDLYSLKSSLMDESTGEIYKDLGSALKKCLKEISTIVKKNKFECYVDLSFFNTNKTTINYIFELGFNNIVATSDQIIELKTLFNLEEKSKIISRNRRG